MKFEFETEGRKFEKEGTVQSSRKEEKHRFYQISWSTPNKQAKVTFLNAQGSPVHTDSNAVIYHEEMELKVEDCEAARRHLEHNTSLPFSNDLLLKDYELLHREILDIKSCRANIFVRTLAIIGAIMVGILAILGNREKSSGEMERWLLWASTVPSLLLLSAILSTIHKARGINKREGLMAAIAKGIAYNKPLKHYGGLTRAHQVDELCEYIDKDKNHHKCRKMSIEEIKPFTKNIPYRAKLLNTFTSLSTYIYGFTFFLCTLGILWSILYMLNIKTAESQTQRNNFLFSAGAGIFVVFLAYGLKYTFYNLFKKFISPLFKENKNKDKLRKFMRNIMFFFSLLIMSLVVIVLLILYIIFPAYTDVIYFGYLIGGCVSLMATYIGISCFTTVDSLRKGKHSVECWKHTWEYRFDNCPLMNIDSHTYARCQNEGGILSNEG
jgi:hypothetical protein